MNKYNDIEIKTAENLLKEGYKWIIRDTSFYGNTIIFALKERPHRNTVTWSVTSECRTVCTDEVPIFQNISSDDKEPVSLESIVHPQILDDVEREYLSAVIKPFRDKVRSISKVVENISEDYTDCHLFIRFADASDDMSFPTFREGKMYEGMEPDRWYSLEELGL